MYRDLNAIYFSFPYPGFRKGRHFCWYFYRLSMSKKLKRLFPVFMDRVIAPLWGKYCVEKGGFQPGDIVLLEGNPCCSPMFSGAIVRQLENKGCFVAMLIVDSIIDRKELGSGANLWLLSFAEYFSLIYSYDLQNARRYDWHHTLQYYSRIPEGCLPAVNEPCDIFGIVNRGKGRLEKLVEIYDKLTEKGVKCLFYIYGFDDEGQKRRHQRSGIRFDQFISYEENLAHVLQAKVILEVVKYDDSGFSLRPFEAVCYNRRLLTTCKRIKEFPMYDPQNMKLIENADDLEQIDPIFFTDENLPDYHYDDRFSPCGLIADIVREYEEKS